MQGEIRKFPIFSLNNMYWYASTLSVLSIFSNWVDICLIQDSALPCGASRSNV